MKRKIDELGRLVIPSEMRKELNINSGDSVDIEVVDNKVIVTTTNTIDYKQIVRHFKEWLKEQIDYLTKIDGQNIPLNDKFQFCSMNELYQTGKYSGYKDTLEKIEELENGNE